MFCLHKARTVSDALSAKARSIIAHTPRKRRRFRVMTISVMTAAALTGAAAGLAAFTFTYAKGFSYFSNRPEACANCHVMREVLHDWQAGDHHHVAVCNDCHVPHAPVAKWVVKALNGFHHSYAFTFLDTPEVLHAGSLSRQVVQANCQRCHSALFDHRPDHHAGSEEPCVRCHRSVGHIH